MFNEKLVNALEVEQGKLLELMEKNLKNGDYGTYKNLIRALIDVVMLIQREYDRQPLVTESKKKKMYLHCQNSSIDVDSMNIYIYFDGATYRTEGTAKGCSNYVKFLCNNEKDCDIEIYYNAGGSARVCEEVKKGNYLCNSITCTQMAFSKNK